MPYDGVSDLPASFKNLPAGAKKIALVAMKAVMNGKEDTAENVQQAIFAAWRNIKRKYRKEGYTWVERGAAVLVDEWTLCDCHRILVDEMVERGIGHNTAWPEAKSAAEPQVMAKKDEAVATPTKTAFFRVLKADEEERTTAGIVYMADDEQVGEWVKKGCPEDEPPEVLDTQGDFITENHLEESFRSFMQDLNANLQMGEPTPFGTRHIQLSAGATLLQSALLVKGTRWPEPESEPLTAALNWVKQIHWADDKDWQAIKEGKLTGFSLEGEALS